MHGDTGAEPASAGAGGTGPCWTRALELRLVALVRERDVLWRPRDNTNHNIQLKYRAYAELARLLAPHATARWVRDRWVNIRSTFNNNLRKVTRSEQRATHPRDVYVPTWPLWAACQFLRRRALSSPSPPSPTSQREVAADDAEYKLEVDGDAPTTAPRPRAPRAGPRRRPPGRPRIPPEFRPHRLTARSKRADATCTRAIRGLVRALRPPPPPAATAATDAHDHWFLSRHVAETLARMRPPDARAATRDIVRLLRNPTHHTHHTHHTSVT